MEKTGLVLEGGGLRAIYGAGVLDRFLELKLTFDYVVGASAGAANGASFLSGQKGRTKRITVNHMTTKRFYSAGNVVRGRAYMDVDYLFNDITDVIDPLDKKALYANPSVFEVTATNVKTGEPNYFEKSEKKFIRAMQASCSIPFPGQDPVKVKKKLLLDGGLVDSIPVRRSAELGYRKIVAVLTQPESYRKKRTLSERLLNIKFRKYPKFLKTMKKRAEHYNQTLEYIKHPPSGVRIFPFYPSSEKRVPRLTRNKEILKNHWELGYADALRKEEELLRFLGD